MNGNQLVDNFLANPDFVGSTTRFRAVAKCLWSKYGSGKKTKWHPLITHRGNHFVDTMASLHPDRGSLHHAWAQVPLDHSLSMVKTIEYLRDRVRHISRETEQPIVILSHSQGPDPFYLKSPSVASLSKLLAGGASLTSEEHDQPEEALRSKYAPDTADPAALAKIVEDTVSLWAFGHIVNRRQQERALESIQARIRERADRVQSVSDIVPGNGQALDRVGTNICQWSSWRESMSGVTPVSESYLLSGSCYIGYSGMDWASYLNTMRLYGGSTAKALCRAVTENTLQHLPVGASSGHFQLFNPQPDLRTNFNLVEITMESEDIRNLDFEWLRNNFMELRAILAEYGIVLPFPFGQLPSAWDMEKLAEPLLFSWLLAE